MKPLLPKHRVERERDRSVKMGRRRHTRCSLTAMNPKTCLHGYRRWQRKPIRYSKHWIGCWRMTSCISKCERTWASAIASPWCMGGIPRQWKSFCACCSASISTNGVIEKLKSASRIAWCCAGFAACILSGSPMRRRGSRWLHTLRPETLHALNDRVVELARQAKVTSGRKLRLDATCVQTEIHHPTDSGLLVDGVRVLSRFVKRAKELITDQAHSLEQTCRSRLRSAKRVAQQLHRQLRRKGEDKEAEQKQLYQKLIEITERMVQQASRVVVALGQQSEQQAMRLRTQAEGILPLVKGVITQTRKRVLEGKKVASDEKVISLFEPHTRAIPRHKGGALVEFGRQVVLDEVEGGIVTRYEILEHPNEHGQAVEAVAHHQALFEHPPNLVAGDRGVPAADTEERL